MDYTIKKFWIARDESDELRMYADEPYWMPDGRDLGNGFFTSESPSWQIDKEWFRWVKKGDKKIENFWLSPKIKKS